MLKMLSTLFLCMATIVNLYAASEQTLAIVKPDAVAANHTGAILSRYESNNLRIVALRMTQLSKAQAEQFYAIHKERPFFQELVNFMSSGPVVAFALEGDNAVARNREIIGATNPKDAAKGTIRADFAKSISENAIHGSDSLENAKNEIAFFFSTEEIFLRK
jgi:nucleoside-diphosphate kinase